MKNVECCTALQGDARPDQRVGAEGIENVDQPDHTLQRPGLELPLGRDVLKRFSRRDHQTPSKAASTACAGRSTRHGYFVEPVLVVPIHSFVVLSSA